MNRGVLQKVGSRIKILRIRAGLTQEAVAEKCSIDRSYYGSVERGESNISILTLCEILEFFSVKIEDFFQIDPQIF